MADEPISKSGTVMELINSDASLEIEPQGAYSKESKKPQVVFDDMVGEEPAPKVVGDRDQWGSKVQFFLTVVAYAVGLGNVWRFPYLCQQNGGGAFLIPYFIMLFFEGIPLFLLELGIGQKMRLGSISVWNKIHPMLGGIGIASAMAAFLVGIYYIVIIAWCLYYFFMSFRVSLLWDKCEVFNQTDPRNPGSFMLKAANQCEASPPAHFWYINTLDITESIEDVGGMNWKIFGCYSAAWVFIFFTVFRGIKSSGKVIYFTALFPYVVLIIFLIRGITLPGAFLGIEHLFTPDFSKLIDPQVWLAAATQIFYSFGLGFGSLISFGSYNDEGSDIKRDVLAVSFVNGVTAILSAVVVFAVLGFMSTEAYHNCIYEHIHNAAETGLVEDFKFVRNFTKDNFTETFHSFYEDLRRQDWVVDGQNITEIEGLKDFGSCNMKEILNNGVQGTGLVFIIFTEAISKMPGGPIFALLFFLKLLTLGIGSMIGNLEGVITPIDDLKLRPWLQKWLVSLVTCVVSFFVGMIFVTRGGEYFVKMFDDWAGTFSLTSVALVEMVAVGWIYGADRFADDIQEMTGRHVGRFWRWSWKFIGPILVGAVIVSSLYKMVSEGLKYKMYDTNSMVYVKTPYPGWAVFLVYFVIALGALPIPIVAVMRRLGFRKLELAVSQAHAALGTTISTVEMLESNDDLDEAEEFEKSLKWNNRT